MSCETTKRRVSDMGEYADMMIGGEVCSGCGVFFEGIAPGYPRKCRACQSDNRLYRVKQAVHKPFKCKCGKKFSTQQGREQHYRDVHEKKNV